MLKDNDLREIEKRAFRSFHGDGLVDMMIGIVFLLWASGPLLENLNLPRALIQTPLMVFLPIALIIAKKKITIPRLGTVKFGPRRKLLRRKNIICDNYSRCSLLFYGSAGDGR